ncbi:eukaryotic translation initiation factor 2c [Dactylonectria macrodidyma]|uniref:Eukaryotic translation initiation factor 2c n=1 Tax=Dactylonectria macrodidyma TaxID=307937 RepID=A0A9P9FB97_9HYPO|nr:eukaryotic translation initiation factor 2c [Dactylonectria macrodidyma]
MSDRSDRGRSPSPSGKGSTSGERRPSQSPSGTRSDSPSRSAAGGKPSSGWKQGPGFDPARGPPKQERGNTRVELPPDAYISATNKDFFTLREKKLNTEGKVEQIEVNQYRMTKFDFAKKIYQYDVILSPEPDKLGPVMKKIWAHPKLKEQLKPYNGGKWLFDGKKLAWAPVLLPRGEIRCKIDLDDGEKRPPGAKARPGADFHLTLRNTTEIKVSALQGYLDHKVSFSSSVQEALNFLDHLVRQWPSEHMLAIKRNFYKRNEVGIPLNDGSIVEVHKGTYASVRMSHNLGRGGVGLGYNIDVANTCFWVGGQPLERLMCNFLANCDRRWQGLTPVTVYQHLKPVKGRSGRWESSDAFKQLRKLRRLKFKVRHAGRRNDEKLYTIVDFVFNEQYGPEGATAKNVTFKDQEDKEMSVHEYYRSKYKVTLRNANLPLIDAGKAGKIPMELAFVESMQRYPFKLNPEQTAAMIKIAVTRPKERKANIEKNARDLQIGSDPYLKEYGVSFETQFAKTEARILPPPIVKFSQGTCEPRFAGRWDLRGKKFWKQNAAPLMNWGFVLLEQGVSPAALQQFANTFKTTFISHGGKVTKEPKILQPPGDMMFNAANCVAWAHEQVTKASGYTQLLFCVLTKRNSGTYERLKKSADCRFGILTQVVLRNHVIKNNGQYHSNVAMKVNAKLGGATACTPQLWKTPTYFPENRPTMIIGVDVSHTAPGGNSPSTAAMTMSVDRDATRYAALVESNGYRVEILTPANMRFLFSQLANYWREGHNNGFPAHIMYFRDGVGEGQFAQVLDNEISEIKAFLRDKTPAGKAAPKFTVIVATKRHHIRFFPQRGDKNANPLPGTLVEKEVTHPFMWDFYLNSHVAIQGTARPVHYHVILDEMNMPVNDLQKMIYQQCYSYARSTTPVSLHPAVYYAHLASDRARAHENIATSEGFRTGPKGHEMIRDKIARGMSVGGPDRAMEAPPLLRLGGTVDAAKGPVNGEERQRAFFRKTMWYI